MGVLGNGHLSSSARFCSLAASEPKPSRGSRMSVARAVSFSLVPQQYGLAIVEAITLVDHSHIIASATPDYVMT